MKCVPLVLALLAVVPCGAQTQTSCASSQLADAANRVHRIQDGLKQVRVEEMDTDVPPAARDLIIQLKNGLSCATDATLAGAGPSMDAAELQRGLSRVLNANPPEPPQDGAVSKNDHRFDEALGSYGHNLRVQVTRPSSLAGLIEVEFSFNIECGEDHMLLVYAPRSGVWRRQMRWQAPPLKKVSDAFGDFFLVANMPAARVEDTRLRVVVAHGAPWCTSRFSYFSMDVFSPASDPLFFMCARQGMDT